MKSIVYVFTLCPVDVAAATAEKVEGVREFDICSSVHCSPTEFQGKKQARCRQQSKIYFKSEQVLHKPHSHAPKISFVCHLFEQMMMDVRKHRKIESGKA